MTVLSAVIDPAKLLSWTIPAGIMDIRRVKQCTSLVAG